MKSWTEKLKALVAPGPEEPVERRANRAERRAWVKSCGRDVRLAYGFGRIDRIPPGIFIRPARPPRDDT